MEEDPDSSAVVLLERLQETDPDRFNRAHLRTLQRRVQKWRGSMASKLVYTASDAMVPETDEVAGNSADDRRPHVLIFRQHS